MILEMVCFYHELGNGMFLRRSWKWYVFTMNLEMVCFTKILEMVCLYHVLGNAVFVRSSWKWYVLTMNLNMVCIYDDFGNGMLKSYGFGNVRN